METFINRWLWLMNLNEIRRLKESIFKHQQSAANAQAKPTAVTSPNELPPPSPASSIGSSAGSNNNSSSNQQNGTHNASQSQPDTNQQQNQQQQQQADSTQKLVVLYERYLKLNEYNIRSQNFWDSNEHQISEVDYLNGLSLIIYFCYSFVCKRFMIACK